MNIPLHGCTIQQGHPNMTQPHLYSPWTLSFVSLQQGAIMLKWPTVLPVKQQDQDSVPFLVTDSVLDHFYSSDVTINHSFRENQTVSERQTEIHNSGEKKAPSRVNVSETRCHGCLLCVCVWVSVSVCVFKCIRAWTCCLQQTWDSSSPAGSILHCSIFKIAAWKSPLNPPKWKNVLIPAGAVICCLWKHSLLWYVQHTDHVKYVQNKCLEFV